MGGFRDIKRKARRDLHRGMRVPALYLVSRADPNPIPCFIRPHTKYDNVGGQFHAYGPDGEFSEAIPKLVIDRLEIPAPTRGAFVSVEPGEVYQISHTDPADGEFVKVHVTLLTNTNGFPFPGIPVVPEPEPEPEPGDDEEGGGDGD